MSIGIVAWALVFALADEPAIAPPSPEAPPQKVEAAKKKAKAAELHPILPSPHNPLKPAFQLYAEIDLPILGLGLAFDAARLVRVQKASCAPLCDPADLNAFDRRTAGYWNPHWQTASNVGLAVIGLGSVSLLLIDEGVLPALNDTAVIAESALAGTAAAAMITLATGRPRPYLYGEKAPLEQRNKPDAALSFVSSHSVIAFSVATSTVMTMARLHPGSKAPWIVMAVGGTLASFVAAARVLGGMHFITDAVGGAAVGTSMGVLVPALHASPVTVVPVAGEAGQRGLALSARF